MALPKKIVDKMNANWPSEEELKDFKFSTHGRPAKLPTAKESSKSKPTKK